MSKFVFGKRSEGNFVGVHPRLIKVTRLALTLTRQDFINICGLRTDAEQAANFKSGASKVKFSKHQKQKSGYGEALDLLPVSAAGVDAWQDTKGFQNIRVAMFAAAKILGEKIRWGKDWNMNGKTFEEGDKQEKFPDSPHFEIILQ